MGGVRYPPENPRLPEDTRRKRPNPPPDPVPLPDPSDVDTDELLELDGAYAQEPEDDVRDDPPRIRFSGLFRRRRHEEPPDEPSHDPEFMVPKRRERSIRTQWLTQSVSVVVLLLVVAATVFIVAVSSLLHQNMRTNLGARVNAAVAFFNKYASASDNELYAGAKVYIESYEDKDIVELQFLDRAGRIVASSSGLAAGLPVETDDLTAAIRKGESASWVGVDPASGERVMAVSAPVIFPAGEIVAVIRCVSSLANLRSRMLLYALMAVVVCVFILAFVLLSNSFFIRSILTPLQQVNDTAMLIAQGRYGVHIAPVYQNEIGQLCTTINHMSDAVSQAEKTKNDFISSVSHELRTPLTAIGGWSETLLSGGVDDRAEVERGLHIIRDEASRLSRMVEELLDFSRMESGELMMRMERADILPDLEDVVFMYMDTLQKEGMTLEFHEDEDCPQIVCDRARLRQVFLNILDNARKHGGDGKRILVTARRMKSTIDVVIRDFGQGIPPDELPHVKDRFYKGSTRARGNGIGLAVADEIVRLHGGRLDIASEVGKGTTVTISLPL
ncbi:MAG: HAMP domain-containing histidine kinase [Clostridiales bacterium]|nr:HAMP domain-containing histidine kinase [Clostridiales bacterium]